MLSGMIIAVENILLHLYRRQQVLVWLIATSLISRRGSCDKTQLFELRAKNLHVYVWRFFASYIRV